MPVCLPPSLLIADAVNRAVMGATKRDREFIARLAAERARLHESQVMGVGRLAGAEEARLLGDEPKMLLVAVATRRANGEHALVDPARAGRGSVLALAADLLRAGELELRNLSPLATVVADSAGKKPDSFCSNASSNILASAGREAVLAGKGFAGPAGCAVLRSEASNLAQETVA